MSDVFCEARFAGLSPWFAPVRRGGGGGGGDDDDDVTPVATWKAG
jgi:hypothetical protein